jgi:hypothetical protein
MYEAINILQLNADSESLERHQTAPLIGSAAETEIESIYSEFMRSRSTDNIQSTLASKTKIGMEISKYLF